MSKNKIRHAWTGFNRRPYFSNHSTATELRPAGSNRCFSLFLLMPLLISVQASATTLVYKSFDDLVKESDAIVSGRVASIDSRSSANHEIYTFVMLDQLDVVGGAYRGQTLTLRFKGGQVGNNISRIVGSPEFNVDDHVVMFVQGNGQYMVPVVGWTQGVFRVTQDPATGQQVIHDHEGNRVLGVRAGQLVKEQTAQPAAHIVGQNPHFVSTASEKKGEAGSADNNLPSPMVGTEQTAALAAMPTMTSQAFLSTIRKSASARTFEHEVKSVSPGDFSLAGTSNPAASNSDGSIGPKPAVIAIPQSQSPAKPQRKPVPQGPQQF